MARTTGMPAVAQTVESGMGTGRPRSSTEMVRKAAEKVGKTAEESLCNVVFLSIWDDDAGVG
jgi:hypothetical protein